MAGGHMPQVIAGAADKPAPEKVGEVGRCSERRCSRRATVVERARCLPVDEGPERPCQQCSGAVGGVKKVEDYGQSNVERCGL